MCTPCPRCLKCGRALSLQLAAPPRREPAAGAESRSPTVWPDTVSIGDKSGLIISDPKTSHPRRPVRLSALAVQALRTHRARLLEERLAMGEVWEDHDLVFCNSIGRPCEARNVIRKSYAPLLAKAGISHIKFHALRHSAATLLLSQGIHPKIVAEMLGHTTISMTLDIYSHVTLDMQQEAADTMDRLFCAQGGAH